MSLTYKVVLVWVICLSYKVAMTGCEVVLVNRNVTDSFRVGQDGCTNNASVCITSSTCQPSSGLCLCAGSEPNFRNPAILSSDDKAYGCRISKSIRLGFGGTNFCAFEPFQLIPYSHEDPVTQFSQKETLQSCSLRNARAKFPDNSTEMELKWLNKSYVYWTSSDKTLHFKWKRSVPDLQGTIISLSFRCNVGSGTYKTQCLRAKVLGTWSAGKDTSPTGHPTSVVTSEPATSVLSPNPTVTKSPTTSAMNPNTTMAKLPTASARSSPPSEVSSGTIVAIAVVVPIVLLIVLVVVVWLVCKRKTGNSKRNSNRGSSGKKNGTSSMKQFRHTDSNLRGPDTDVPARDTTSATTHSNLAYATTDNQSVIVEANPAYEAPDVKMRELNGADSNPEPAYETPDFKRREINSDDSYPEPAYETPDLKRKEINDNDDNSYPEPGYETPDVKRKDAIEVTPDSAYSTLDGYSTPDVKKRDVNPGYSIPDVKKGLVNSGYSTPDVKKRDIDPGYSTPDVKKMDVNPTYSTPDVKKRDVNPGYSTPDSDIRNEDNNAGLSTPDIKRVEINGDLYALPDKNTKKGQGLNYMDLSKLVFGSQEKNESNDQSGQPTEYADIVEAKPKKKK